MFILHKERTSSEVQSGKIYVFIKSRHLWIVCIQWLTLWNVYIFENSNRGVYTFNTLK